MKQQQQQQQEQRMRSSKFNTLRQDKTTRARLERSRFCCCSWLCVCCRLWLVLLLLCRCAVVRMATKSTVFIYYLKTPQRTSIWERLCAFNAAQMVSPKLDEMCASRHRTVQIWRALYEWDACFIFGWDLDTWRNHGKANAFEIFSENIVG